MSSMSTNSRVLVACEGDFVASNTSSIAFLWRNWHYYFRLANKYVACEATSDLSWEFSGLGGVGEWYLTQYDCGTNSGILHFYNYVRFLGVLGRAQSIFVYDRLADGRVWYAAGGGGPVPSGLVIAIPVIKLIINFAARSIGKTGGQVAENVTRNPGLLDAKCGFEARSLYEVYVAEENARADATKMLTHFGGYQLRPIAIYEDQGNEVLGEVKERLASRVSRITANASKATDVTLLKSAVRCVGYGVPYVGLVAVRDFVRQHKLGLPTFQALGKTQRQQLSKLEGRAGGTSRTYYNMKDMLMKEVALVEQALDVVEGLLHIPR